MKQQKRHLRTQNAEMKFVQITETKQKLVIVIILLSELIFQTNIQCKYIRKQFININKKHQIYIYLFIYFFNIDRR